MIRHRVRVGYVDTDQGGVVHHSVYLRWLEQARVEYLREHDCDYRSLEYDEQFALPVAKASVAYRRPARFDEELEVLCWVGKLGAASVRFDYRIERDGELVTEAEITLACIKLPEQKLVRLPPRISAACQPEAAPQ